MRFPALLFAAFFFLPRAALGDDDAELTPTIAKSGKVEIFSLHIERQRISGAPKSESEPFLSIDMWLGEGSIPSRSGMLLKVVSLDPIEDDTGKLLSTKARRGNMPFLRHETPISDSGTPYANRSGPLLSLVVDAPARQATKIKSLKGKAVLSKLKVAALGFKDLAALDGRPLAHPKLKNLEIRATLKHTEQATQVTLRLPGNDARVLHWGLAKDGAMLTELGNPFPEPVELPEQDDVPLGDAPAVDQVKEYALESAKDAILGIALAEPTEPEEFEFEFKDLELP